MIECSTWLFDKLIEIAGIAVAAIIPVIVLIVSLNHSKKQQADALNAANNKFLKSQKLQKEEIRVSKMPYLQLSRCSSGTEKATLEVKNCGNGAAFKVHPKLIGDSCEIFKGNSVGGIPADLIQSGNMSDSIIPVGNVGKFDIAVSRHVISNSEPTSSKISCGSASVTLCFKDSFFNEYEQAFCLTIDATLDHFEIRDQGLPRVTKLAPCIENDGTL